MIKSSQNNNFFKKKGNQALLCRLDWKGEVKAISLLEKLLWRKIKWRGLGGVMVVYFGGTSTRTYKAPHYLGLPPATAVSTYALFHKQPAKWTGSKVEWVDHWTHKPKYIYIYIKQTSSSQQPVYLYLYSLGGILWLDGCNPHEPKWDRGVSTSWEVRCHIPVVQALSGQV